MKSESEVAQSCPTLSDPMDCSIPGSSIHGIFQARVLEWGAIAFSIYALYIYIISEIYICKLKKYSQNRLACEIALDYFPFITWFPKVLLNSKTINTL